VSQRSTAAEQFRRRLVAAIVGGVLLTAGVAILTLAQGSSRLLHAQLADRAAADARALAVALTPLLEAGDLAAARERLRAAAELPDLAEATLALPGGVVLASTAPQTVGRPAGGVHRRAARERTEVRYEAGSAEAGDDAFLVAWPVIGKRTPEAAAPAVLGTVALRFSTADLGAALRTQGLVSGAWVLLGAVGIGFAVYLLFLRQGLRPLDRLVAALERMAEGDLSTRVDTRELGAFAGVGEALNEMWGSFGHLAERVVALTGRLHGVTERLGAAMREIELGSESQVESTEDTASLLAKVNQSIRQVNGEIEDLSRSTEEASSSTLELSSSVEEVARSVGSLNEAVESSSSSSQEMGASIQQVAESADEVQRMAEETAASMTEMDRAIQEVSDHVTQASELTEKVSQGAEEGSQAVDSTIEGIETIRSTTGDARTVLEQLVARIGEIGDILTVIGEINDETNLLSLNAAIIAAQAGEQGKAFAVVANHVKTLAQRTAMSTQEIERLIRSVQDESGNAMKAMAAGIDAVQTGVERSRKAGDALTRIRRLASDANDRVAEITRAAQEQGRNSRHVTDAANRTSAMVQKISSAMAEQSRASVSLLETSESALGVCRQVQRSTEEQRETSSFITDSIARIGERMRTIQENVSHHRQASETVAEALQRVLEVAHKTGGRVPEIVAIVEQLHRDAQALEAEVGRFRRQSGSDGAQPPVPSGPSAARPAQIPA